MIKYNRVGVGIVIFIIMDNGVYMYFRVGSSCCCYLDCSVFQGVLFFYGWVSVVMVGSEVGVFFKFYIVQEFFMGVN